MPKPPIVTKEKKDAKEERRWPEYGPYPDPPYPSTGLPYGSGIYGAGDYGYGDDE